MTATTNADGTFSVSLPEPGTYTITYASGPDKGKVIERFTATKPGRHDIAVKPIRNLGSEKTTTSASFPAKSETRDLKRDTKVEAAGTSVKPRPSHSVSPEATAAPRP